MFTELAGAILGGIGSAMSARQQQEAQMGMQIQNQQWQEHMSNTAHQREIEDLKAAGLNPVLSAGGNGANTGSVGTGTASMADMTAGVNNALTAMKNAELIDAQKENLEADAELKQSQSGKTKSEKEILDIQKQYTQPTAEASLKLMNAKTGTERNLAMKYYKESTLANAEAFKTNLENQMLYMDKAKRITFYKNEVELYKAQLKKDLVKAGLQGNELYNAIDSAFETVGKVFHAGNNTSTSTSTHASQSTVNIHK